MLSRLAADGVLVVHLAFILFVSLGALLVLRRPRMAWVHLPAAAWGAWVELAGRICPLTPLEDRLRESGGDVVTGGDFIGRTLLAVIYPTGLTRTVQLALGIGVLVVNGAIYALLIARHVRRRSGGTERREPGGQP
jgi:hypothetical protein